MSLPQSEYVEMGGLTEPRVIYEGELMQSGFMIRVLQPYLSRRMSRNILKDGMIRNENIRS